MPETITNGNTYFSGNKDGIDPYNFLNEKLINILLSSKYLDGEPWEWCYNKKLGA